MLLDSEMAEVESKIAALERVRHGLERSLVGLQEEELELNDEHESVAESLALQKHRSAMPGTSTAQAAQAAAESGGTTQSNTRTPRRSKAPLFLPSEHDELPSGVAFMSLLGHTAPITALDFSEPYGTLVSAAGDDAVTVWDLTAARQVGRLRGHKGKQMLCSLFAVPC